MEIEGLLGRKIGMTTLYKESGAIEGVTLVEVGPCVITQIRTEAHDGYDAIQIGFGTATRLNKPSAGHQSRSGGKFRHVKEFGVENLADFEVGQSLTADVFQAGDIVKARGRSKGRGFSGGMRRHNFRGGPKTHGQSDRFRAPGSIGAGSSPGHVWKGTRMAGHYGNANITTRGLRVELVDAEKNLLAIRGSVPGARGGLVEVFLESRKASAGAAA